MMTVIIAALPCLAWAASIPTLTLTGQSIDVGESATLAPFVMYQSLGQGNDYGERGLQLYGATSQVQVGESDSLTWMGGFFISKTYQTRTADHSAPASPLDFSRVNDTASWFREPGGAGAAAMLNISGSRAYRQLLGEDRLTFQRLALKAGALAVSGEYLDVGAKFQGANNLAGQLPDGLDARALQAARGIDNLKLAAELQPSSNIKFTSKLTRVSNLQPGHKQYGLSRREVDHRLEATLGADTSMSLVMQTLDEDLNGQSSATKSTTLKLGHTFGDGRTFSLTDRRLNESVGGSKSQSHTRTMNLAWTFDPRLKLKATLSDADTNGTSTRTRELRLNWAANSTTLGLRQVATGGASAQTSTTFDVGTRLLGGALTFSRHAVDSQAGGQLTNRLTFDGTYGKTHLTLNQVNRSGAPDKPETTTSLKIASALDVAGTPVALNASYGRGIIDANTNGVSNPGGALRLVADWPGLNLIADLKHDSSGRFGSRLYLVRDPKEATEFGPWGGLLLATLSANDVNRSNYEHVAQLGSLRLAIGQRMIARTDGNGNYPAVYTNFDFSRGGLPKWANTLGGSMFGTDSNYEFAVLPGVQPMRGRTGLRLGMSRLTPGDGSGLVQTLDYAAVLGGEYLVRVYLGRAAGNVPADTPAHSALLELSSRYHGKLSWVARFTRDQTGGSDSARQVFGLCGSLSAREKLALTLLRQSDAQAGPSGLGVDYSRHISDDHYLTVKALYGAGSGGPGYRIDLAYQKPW